MKNRLAALLCIAPLALAVLACALPGLATPTQDIGTQVALVLTQTAVAATQTALAQPPTPPAEPTQPPPATETPTLAPAATGSIMGKLCYPSEGIPPLTVFAREINTQNTVTIQTAENQGEYAVEVPAPGTYIVFAYTDFGIGGTFSPAVPCGLSVSCTDHSPVQLDVQPGAVVANADICDFYGPPGSLPPNPNVSTAKIMGQLCYPSEGIPPLTVYAREVNSNQTYTLQTAQDQSQYSLDVPAPGTYIVFAYVQGGGLGGSYSQAVPCGLTAACTDHTPIQLALAPGATQPDVNICDYYGPEGSVPPP